DRDVNTGLEEILVARRSDLDQRGRLAAANALLLTGDADRAAADADLDKVRARVSEEAEALAVNHVARADPDAVAVVLANPRKRAALPLGKALGRVDAQH